MFFHSSLIQRLSLFLILLFAGISVSVAQTLTKVAQTPEFTDYVLSNDSLKVTLAFELLVSQNPNGQVFRVMEQELVRISAKQAGIESLQHPLREKLTGTDTPLIQLKSPGIARRQQVVNLIIHQARIDHRNQQDVLVVKHLRLRVFHPQTQTTATARLAESNIQPASQLSSGTWHRIDFERNGIYQLDAAFLTELGINVSQIDPRNIQIWGTDGHELPLLNSEQRPHLQQIPIIVEGESDGSFNTGDRVLFYGNSPHRIIHTPNGPLTHEHKLHPFSRYNSVFLTVANNRGLRLQEDNASYTAQQTITEFTDFLWIEQELYKSESRIKSGQQWFGQVFDGTVNRTQSILRDTIPGFSSNSTITMQLGMAARSQATSSFDFIFNGTSLNRLNMPSILNYSSSTGNSATMSVSSQSAQIQAPDQIFQLDATYNPGDGQARGWVNFIRMNFPRQLIAKNNQLMFYPPSNGSSQNGARYVLSGFSSAPYVLDVTNPESPVWISTSTSGNNYEFEYHTAPETQLFAASRFLRPSMAASVENQHISAINGHPNYIIITSEALLQQARELAQYREQRDGLSSIVVTQRLLFNEFNGGVPDITAIRDFVRYIYNRAPDVNSLPEYLLFFGNTTYDYKGIIGGVPMTNHVFTYQTPESVNRVRSYATDDFFGLLESSKGDRIPDVHLDIGIGRLTVNTPAQAERVIEKIKRYEDPVNRGDWRSIFTFLADDDVNPSTGGSDRDLHILNADGVAQRIPQDETGIRLEKIYQLDYPTVNTAGGARVPLATQAMVNRINNGTLVINFSGHGNEDFLTSQRLFTLADIDRLTNRDKLTIFVTATCDYGRYDDNERFSGAERLLIETESGIIAAFTTTRVVYTDANPTGVRNFALNIQLTEQMLIRDDEGLPRRMGDIFLGTKNTTAGMSENSKKFILLGDPAMRIGLPETKIDITSVNNIETAQVNDPIQLRSLDRVNIEGNILLPNGQINTAFSGEATVRVFDAGRLVSYPARDWVPDLCRIPECGYSIQKDILFNGRVSVTNGRFSSEFIIPKDIAYSDSTGRIQVYSNSMNTDAVGSWSKFFVNGRNPDAVDDGTGPEIDLFLNDETFMNGFMVNDSPIIRAFLQDDSGINTAGAGVGHEIIAILTRLDESQNQQTFILNEFYQSEQNDFTKGSVEYPLNNLPKGEYELTLRAWDVFNNVGESSIIFEVSEAQGLIVRNLYNYPNPMHNSTRFVFEHNQPGQPMDINIRIFTLTGRPVAQIKREAYISSGNLVQIEWNGIDDDYDRLANGTYLYHVKISTDTSEGKRNYEKTERLVIIR